MDGASYDIVFPDYIDTDSMESNRMLGIDVYVEITNAHKKRTNDGEPDEIVLSDDSTVVVLDDEDIFARRLGVISFTGSSSMLVVRINTPVSAVSLSKDDLADSFFGTKGDEVTFKSQMSACSGGKKTFRPATGTNVDNGVVDVYLTTSLNGAHHSSYLNLAKAAAEARIGQDLSAYDHVAYCSPPNVVTGWIAYGECKLFKKGRMHHRLQTTRRVGKSMNATTKKKKKKTRQWPTLSRVLTNAI